MPEQLLAWPPHLGGLHIMHNQHHGYYEKLDKAISPPGMRAGAEDYTYDRTEFRDENEVQRAIAADSVWTIQWYPLTPVSFYRVHAATLEHALLYALEVDRQEGAHGSP